MIFHPYTVVKQIGVVFMGRRWRAAVVLLAATAASLGAASLYQHDFTEKTVAPETLEQIEQAVVPLEGDYDFNHNGIKETLLLAGNIPADEGNDLHELIQKVTFCELRLRENGVDIWKDCAGVSHASWNSLFFCRIGGEDYLLRYTPYMSIGIATLSYQIFSLNSDGNEVLFQSNDVQFDNNFSSPFHDSFDAAEIANFLEEVHGYLRDSMVLLSTEGGDFRCGGSGADFEEDCFRGNGLYENSGTLEDNLRAYEAECLAGQAEMQ